MKPLPREHEDYSIQRAPYVGDARWIYYVKCLHEECEIRMSFQQRSNEDYPREAVKRYREHWNAKHAPTRE